MEPALTPVQSSPAMQISVATEVKVNNPTHVVNAMSEVSDASKPEVPAASDAILAMPSRPNLIGPFTQGVARQPEVYYSTSTPIKGDYSVSLLGKGNYRFQ